MTTTQEIRARLEAATPGPWGPAFKQTGGMIIDAPARFIALGRHQEVTFQRSLYGRIDADAALIANAPTDLAYLLGELDDRGRRMEASETLIRGYWESFAELGDRTVAGILGEILDALRAPEEVTNVSR